jgi:hypothetical protein
VEVIWPCSSLVKDTSCQHCPGGCSVSWYHSNEARNYFHHSCEWIGILLEHFLHDVCYFAISNLLSILEVRCTDSHFIFTFIKFEEPFKLSSGLSCFKVGFEVFTAVSMKMAVFWVVAPCSLVTHRPDDGGSKDL